MLLFCWFYLLFSIFIDPTPTFTLRMCVSVRKRLMVSNCKNEIKYNGIEYRMEQNGIEQKGREQSGK
jgi:hypothetical protein